MFNAALPHFLCCHAEYHVSLVSESPETTFGGGRLCAQPGWWTGCLRGRFFS